MQTLINRYVRIDITNDYQFEAWLVEETFDLGEYTRAEIKWAVECPVNRHGVREKMGWSDWQLDQNPEVLFNHFLEKNGHDWFRIYLRPKYIKTNKYRLGEVSSACFLSDVKAQCKKCPQCVAFKNYSVHQ